MKYIKRDPEHIVEYEVDETGAMLYASDTEETHILNDTAYFLYKCLEEPADMDQLYQRMEQVYEIPAESKKDVLEDIQNCVSLLCEKGLICVFEERAD